MVFSTFHSFGIIQIQASTHVSFPLSLKKISFFSGLFFWKTILQGASYSDEVLKSWLQEKLSITNQHLLQSRRQHFGGSPFAIQHVPFAICMHTICPGTFLDFSTFCFWGNIGLTNIKPRRTTLESQFSYRRAKVALYYSLLISRGIFQLQKNPYLYPPFLQYVHSLSCMKSYTSADWHTFSLEDQCCQCTTNVILSTGMSHALCGTYLMLTICCLAEIQIQSGILYFTSYVWQAQVDTSCIRNLPSLRFSNSCLLLNKSCCYF